MEIVLILIYRTSAATALQYQRPIIPPETDKCVPARSGCGAVSLVAMLKTQLTDLEAPLSGVCVPEKNCLDRQQP